jgi:hypothetical protein
MSLALGLMPGQRGGAAVGLPAAAGISSDKTKASPAIATRTQIASWNPVVAAACSRALAGPAKCVIAVRLPGVMAVRLPGAVATPPAGPRVAWACASTLA